MRPLDLQIVGHELAIKWDDGHQSFTGHKRIDRVELAAQIGNEI